MGEWTVDRRTRRSGGRGRWRQAALVATAASAQWACLPSAGAFEWDGAQGDLKLHWDNSVKYSAAFRVREPSATLLGDANQDDGDRNFQRRGLVSNRVDLLSDLDVVWQDRFGARLSGAAWYDAVYQRGNRHDAPATANATSVAANEFTAATRAQHGRKGELLDAFVFAKGDLGGQRWGVRAGRHTLLWGETLFFGANGIAGGQAPVDLVKLLSVPNAQFKEIIRPTGQLSGSLQVTPDLLLGAYWQYEWEKTRLPAVGSYFSGQDLFDVGGERFFVPPFLSPTGVLARGQDLPARDHGQGGLQVRFRLPGGQTDFGLYAIRYHDKTPQFYVNPLLGTYSLAYHEGVRSYGLSANRTFGDVNLAAEVSVRHNAPLVNDTALNFSPAAATAGNPQYPVGKTAHANVSTIWTLPATPLFTEAVLLAEVAFNRRLSVSNSAGTLAALSTRDAWGLRMQLTPTYRQVLPGLDLDVPIGLGFNPQGRSQAVSFFNGGVHRGGDLSIGLLGNYLNTWKAGVTYTHYVGAEGTTLDSQGRLSFKHNLRDRDFIAVTAQTTF
jgi:hypothetical protein